MSFDSSKNYSDLEVYELVEKCQLDDKQALEELLRRHEKIIYSTLYHLDPKREDIADLVQEVLVKVAKNVKKIRNPKTFKYWLNQIIMNLFYDELRKKTRKIQTISMDTAFVNKLEDEIPQGFDVEDMAKKPHEEILGGELDEIIKKGIDELPEQFRIVTVLRELQGLSYEEIAQLTGTNIGTVKSRLARARAKLQEIIKPYLS
ncbi:MAG: sigma-70 family RNA polymerase sigma factor [Candidatus Gastranaerophilales bacterium]|nr:sigma-70 family RNA polymerase sigma factor [Candidatus Gastranaerophilales bacterium]